jgi:hypothetical protein
MVVTIQRYFYDSLIRFELGRQHYELLAKLQKEIKEDQQQELRALAKQKGLKIVLPKIS